jgi:hypothetical protein
LQAKSIRGLVDLGVWGHVLYITPDTTPTRPLNKANTYAIVYGLQTAKKPETRAKRIQQFVAI